MTPAIEAEGLAKRFGTTRALDGVDLAAPAGTVLALLGPNGSGKTTTVRILTTLLRPDAGRAAVGGYDVLRRPMAVRSLIGLTGQYVTVDEQLSGRENLELFGNLRGRPRRPRRPERPGRCRRRPRPRPASSGRARRRPRSSSRRAARRRTPPGGRGRPRARALVL